MNISKLLTPKQVSEILGIAENTLAIWRLNNRYTLPWVKCGRLIRYQEADVMKFIEQNTIGKTTEIDR